MAVSFTLAFTKHKSSVTSVAFHQMTSNSSQARTIENSFMESYDGRDGCKVGSANPRSYNSCMENHDKRDGGGPLYRTHEFSLEGELEIWKSYGHVHSLARVNIFQIRCKSPLPNATAPEHGR